MFSWPVQFTKSTRASLTVILVWAEGQFSSAFQEFTAYRPGTFHTFHRYSFSQFRQKYQSLSFRLTCENKNPAISSTRNKYRRHTHATLTRCALSIMCYRYVQMDVRTQHVQVRIRIITWLTLISQTLENPAEHFQPVWRARIVSDITTPCRASGAEVDLNDDGIQISEFVMTSAVLNTPTLHHITHMREEDVGLQFTVAPRVGRNDENQCGMQILCSFQIAS